MVDFAFKIVHQNLQIVPRKISPDINTKVQSCEECPEDFLALLGSVTTLFFAFEASVVNYQANPPRSTAHVIPQQPWTFYC